MDKRLLFEEAVLIDFGCDLCGEDFLRLFEILQELVVGCVLRVAVHFTCFRVSLLEVLSYVVKGGIGIGIRLLVIVGKELFCCLHDFQCCGCEVSDKRLSVLILYLKQFGRRIIVLYVVYEVVHKV